ncbi:MAG: hypothetical protein J5507_02375 [Clostridia bacterium]|nr:hypothetical protein [Clostridia bacterium]
MKKDVLLKKFSISVASANDMEKDLREELSDKINAFMNENSVHVKQVVQYTDTKVLISITILFEDDSIATIANKAGAFLDTL